MDTHPSLSSRAASSIHPRAESLVHRAAARASSGSPMTQFAVGCAQNPRKCSRVCHVARASLERRRRKLLPAPRRSGRSTGRQLRHRGTARATRIPVRIPVRITGETFRDGEHRRTHRIRVDVGRIVRYCPLSKKLMNSTERSLAALFGCIAPHTTGEAFVSATMPPLAVAPCSSPGGGWR